jgi:hypothetical protein
MRSNTWKPRLLLLSLPLLAGCATGASDPVPAPVVSSVVNPCDGLLVPEYSPAVQAAVADEMEAAPGAAWVVMVMDYSRMRDAVRACRSAQ